MTARKLMAEFHGSLQKVTKLPLCQPRPAGSRVRTPPGPVCLRGSGEVAPSAPRGKLHESLSPASVMIAWL